MVEKFQGEIQPPEQREFEKSKEKGRNVTIHAIFVRHGEKGVSVTTAETGLSERGEKESIEFGRRLEERKAIKAYTSDTERTIATAKLIVEASPTQKKMRQIVKHGLGFYYNKEGDFVREAMKIKKETLGEDFNSLSEEEKSRRMRESDKRQIDYYLSFGDKRPDPKTYSPVETAARVARRVDVYLRMTERLYSESDVDLINVSHDFPLSAFLKEVLVREKEEKQIRGFDTLDEIGGPIEFNEGFEILIQTDKEGKKSVKMNFRNQEYQIDMERLNELVKIAKTLEEDEKKE